MGYGSTISHVELSFTKRFFNGAVQRTKADGQFYPPIFYLDKQNLELVDYVVFFEKKILSYKLFCERPV